MSDKICSSVGIVGAGIQGVCIGLQLLKKIFLPQYLIKTTQVLWPHTEMQVTFHHMLLCN